MAGGHDTVRPMLLPGRPSGLLTFGVLSFLYILSILSLSDPSSARSCSCQQQGRERGLLWSQKVTFLFIFYQFSLQRTFCSIDRQLKLINRNVPLERGQ
jgi:hypothetical protein